MTSDARPILVTGASTGIGRATVLALLARGFPVYAGVRDPAAGARLMAEAPAGSHARLQILTLDVTDAGQVRAAAHHLERELGDAGLWGLFNNAGISVNGPIEHLGLDGLRHQLEVNVVGQVAVTQAMIPLSLNHGNVKENWQSAGPARGISSRRRTARVIGCLHPR